MEQTSSNINFRNLASSIWQSISRPQFLRPDKTDTIPCLLPHACRTGRICSDCAGDESGNLTLYILISAFDQVVISSAESFSWVLVIFFVINVV